MNLLTLWLVLLICPAIIVYAVYLMEKYLYLRTNVSRRFELNIELALIAGFTYGVLLADMILLFNGQLFSFYILFGLAGMYLELIGDYLWYTFTGTRLFSYYKEPVHGFTSLYNFPFWAYAGIVFWSIWKALGLEISVEALPTYVIHFLAYSNAVLVISFCVIAIFKMRKNKLQFGKHFSAAKYILLLAYVWGGILLTTFQFNLMHLILYFLWGSLFGTILEGLLGLSLKKLFGEYHWLYKRFPIFRGQTSLLIVPLWSTAGLLALLLFSLIGL